jgi:CheY-like chemotaxis protein
MTPPPLVRILYVEDEPDIQAVARLALEGVGGFTVRMCGSGQEAIEAAPVFAPDLIVLDVMMPGLGGVATLEALRRVPETQETPVVFMTAKIQPHEVTQYRRLGAADVVAKPFEPMTLAAALREIWTRHHERS